MNDFHGLQELNLKPSGRSSSRTPGKDAGGKAVAISRGTPFYCSRVKKDVGPANCVAKYNYATAQNVQHSPCLECSNVRTILEKQKDQEMKTSQKPIESTPEKSGAAVFAGWEIYDPYSSRRDSQQAFVSFSASTISFSSAATDGLGLRGFKTATVFVNGKRVGISFAKDNSGRMTVTGDSPKRKGGVKVSAAGVIKALGGIESLQKRRFGIIEHATGVVEIDFAQELRAS